MELSRRKFLQEVGATSGIAALDLQLPAVAAAAEAAKKNAGPSKVPEVKHIKTGCAICPNFCGIYVTLVGGVIRTIHPDVARAEFYNHGICPKGASGMFNTYDPYRLKKPLKRTNPNKGTNEDPRWVEISWEEAFSTISERLAKIKADNPAKLVWQHGQGKYLIQEEYAVAFTKAFGTPNMVLVHRTTACEAARHVADELTWASARSGHRPLPQAAHAEAQNGLRHMPRRRGKGYALGAQRARLAGWYAGPGRPAYVPRLPPEASESRLVRRREISAAPEQARFRGGAAKRTALATCRYCA